jgi:alpha-aminoadipic semialdehyde synthase
MWKEAAQRLLVVGDLTCDINGSVEFLTKSTDIETPFFMYDVHSDKTHHDIMNGEGVLVV